MQILKKQAAPNFAVDSNQNQMRMKTKLTFAVLVMILPFMTGCREDVKSESLRQGVIIVHPVQKKSEDTSRIRFKPIKGKGERTLAMEQAAGRWDRDLFLGGNGPSLDEYVDSLQK